MEEKNHRDWFLAARFGMFIHWGIYAVSGRGEWVKQQENLPEEVYQEYFASFHPVRYHPRDWARAAKATGMKYAVMTAKHHDGFCLFDSAYTDYKATNTPAGRDLIREYVDAFRAEGLKVGLYYSLLDWHHPDYPIAGDRFHPLRHHPEYRHHQGNLPRYAQYVRSQVQELLTNYGRIDLLWFDFSYDNMRGEAWQATELVRMARTLQPGILINDRLGGNLRAKEPEEYAGDFATSEQAIPPEGIRNEAGLPLPWEACLTLNDHWGYAAWDHNWKSTQVVIRALVECVAKGGNLLLNVGPTPKGEIPAPALKILAEVGEWMAQNGESIYGCGPAGLPKPAWGYFTRRGKRVYAHLLERGVGPITLPGLAGQVAYARLLADGVEIPLGRPGETAMNPGDLFLLFPDARLPDGRDTVVELVLK